MDCLAYFITFRTYGSWLPGDERGTVDRQNNRYGAPLREPHAGLKRAMGAQMKHPAPVLDASLRWVVETSIRDECHHRDWMLQALAVRSNHVHIVVSAPDAPERVMNVFKSWATRRLREANLVSRDLRLWARHGSTRCLWNDASVAAACRYVAEGQGDDIPV